MRTRKIHSAYVITRLTQAVQFAEITWRTYDKMLQQADNGFWTKRTEKSYFFLA